MSRIVWPSVAALVFIIASFVLTRSDPPIAYVAGLAAITCAVLALREK